MFEASDFFAGFALGCLIYIGLQILGNASRRDPLPPGPKGLPLVGNLNDLPPPGVFEAHHWLKFKDIYGPISSITVMGQTIIIVNNWKLASQLLDKRSAKHSSRPKIMMAGEMVGWENSLGFSPHNDRFRTHRKNMARIIGSKRAAAKYDRLQEAEVAHFLLHVLDDPERFMDHIRKSVCSARRSQGTTLTLLREAGSVILKIAYGYTAEPFKEDILIKMAGQAMDDVTAAGVPGAFLVDILPLLRYVPGWVPGTNFKRLAKKWSSELDDLAEKPYAFVKHQHALGKQDNSFVSRLLEVGESTEEARFTTKWSALSLYAAGADTTVSSISLFFLAMILYPDVQKKAQEEIDGVIGNERLPNCSDRSSLPYVNAVVKEVLRWNPVVPMGLPHTSTVDDVFEGYFIPKDALIMPNIWYFAHDPEVHHEPMRFNPERFLSTNGNEPEQDPHTYTFGFGRRSLAVLHIRKDGNGAQPELLFTPGMISHPEPFKAAITPRSPHHQQLIRSLEQEFPWEQSDSHIIEEMQRQGP
ncbi:oxidoreductase [Fusarium mundagurra]|uniref:Oxidoreductase n=1 Tax=Fusarium mundagurra TaxID=1567541 RepID=A0A8H6DM54_9HYPO|nr:oxidoreductase [Fusarium mundagurra]